MTSIQERLQIKREPLDKWSIREQLCLASAVARSGDQNWMSVSRALKPFGEPNRPADWFHQKNCAAQYGTLLGNVDTPKRKKRPLSLETGIETPGECILKRLLAERQAELKSLLSEERAEYQKLQEDMKLLQTGKVSEEQLDKWCKEFDEEELKREQESQAHFLWIKQRDLRKQEIEKAWRPPFPVSGQKRKTSDSEDFIENENDDNSQSQQQQYQQFQQSPQNQFTFQHHPHQQLLQQQQSTQQQMVAIQSQESAKPALSPLLTSLLKSPSQVQNISTVSTSILHNAITSQSNQKQMQHGSKSNPTIASLLSSTTGVTVSPGLQHLVSTALGQEISTNVTSEDQIHPLDTDILDDANLKIDDLASSILDQDGPLPEIKKEEVDDIISEIIENAQDIVADPDQHLQLDGNGDININLELDDLDEDVATPEEPPKIEIKEVLKTPEKCSVPPPPPVIDPFEFQEDPVLFDSPVKPSSMKQDIPQYVPLYQQQSPIKADDLEKRAVAEKPDFISKLCEENDQQSTISKNLPGSVEIVEVVAEEGESEKELNKCEIQDIVHSSKENERNDGVKVEAEDRNDSDDIVKQEEDITTEEKEIEAKDESISDSHAEEKVDENNSSMSNLSEENTQEPTISPELPEDLYDNINMEVKIDKTGKTKRDYSRTKKRDEKGFDMLLAIEKAQLEDIDIGEDGIADNKFEGEKKDQKVRLKSENERSNSPWTEEDDTSTRGNKRRYSTPCTPIDSLPNSPASSIAYYDDDREYRNWKKSVMLVYNRLASNKYASLFLKPITEDQAPGYSSVVYRPMDLQTIKKHVDNGIIRTSLEFKRDVMLMFTNAIMYNKTNDTVYNMALQMQQESIHPIDILMQAQGQVDAPLRRETRTSESSCKRKRPAEENLKYKKRKED